MSTKNLGLLLLVGGILVVPVAAWIFPHPVADVAAPDAKAIQAPQSTSESSPAVEAVSSPVQPTCIWGVSKNLCNGSLRFGDWVVTQCGPCINLVGVDALLEVRVNHNTDPCCDTVDIPCDDAEKLVGVLVAKGEYHIRLNDPCPVRGWWQTPWDLYSVDGPLLASGWLDGTIGTGTHRVPLCISPGPVQRCGDKCEVCYMAEFDASSEPGRWIIHVEGSMVGTVLEGQYAGCLVQVTMQGFFTAPADADGLPVPPNKIEAGWKFCGTADGVLDCPCP